MFYRRKILLALLQLFDGRLDKIRLQKLLFLFTVKQDEPAYHFVPYRYGCYSFSANADLTTLAARGMLDEIISHFTRTDNHDYLGTLKADDLTCMQQVKAEYGKMSANALMKHTYVHYPFYATKSEAAAGMLTEAELQKVEAAKPTCSEKILFTIGYEGISLEAYLVRLVKKDVKVLVDVRNNPLSMKYGFSKNRLKECCESLGIGYIHIPEVGIRPDQRRSLNTQADYDALFAVYREQNLKTTAGEQTRILKLLEENRRIALTCFEADIRQCHRKHLAGAIKNLPGFRYKVVHI